MKLPFATTITILEINLQGAKLWCLDLIASKFFPDLVVVRKQIVDKAFSVARLRRLLRVLLHRCAVFIFSCTLGAMPRQIYRLTKSKG